VRERPVGWKAPLQSFHGQGSHTCAAQTATISNALAATAAAVFLSLLPCALYCSLVPSFIEGRAVEGAFLTQGAHTYEILWFLSSLPPSNVFKKAGTMCTSLADQDGGGLLSMPWRKKAF